MFFIKTVDLLIYGCAGASLMHRLFSSRRQWRLLSSCGVQVSYCLGFSCCGAWALGFTGFSSHGMFAQALQLWGSRAQAQIVVVQGLGWSMACGIFLGQELNPHLHWQVNSVPLSHQGLLNICLCIFLQKDIMRKQKLMKIVVCKK